MRRALASISLAIVRVMLAWHVQLEDEFRHFLHEKNPSNIESKIRVCPTT